MIFIEESKLKDAFWSKYKYRKSIMRYQFESPIRKGGVDLLTVERVPMQHSDQDEIIQINTFEFKLADIRKALAQAQENLAFAHKSWVVLPLEKCKIVQDKYMNYLREMRYIGVIGVELDGRWSIIVKPGTQPDSKIAFNQDIAKIMLNIL